MLDLKYRDLVARTKQHINDSDWLRLSLKCLVMKVGSMMMESQDLETHLMKGPSLRIWILSVFLFHLEEKNEDKGWVNHLCLSLKPKSPIIFFWHKNCEKLMQVARGKQVVSLFYFILLLFFFFFELFPYFMWIKGYVWLGVEYGGWKIIERK